MIRAVSLATCCVALLACGRSTDSKIIGEWDCPAIGAGARVSYKSDHTFFARIEGFGSSSGTWHTAGDQIFSHDEHGDSKAQIVELTRDQLQLRGPDGLLSTYRRLR